MSDIVRGSRVGLVSGVVMLALAAAACSNGSGDDTHGYDYDAGPGLDSTGPVDAPSGGDTGGQDATTDTGTPADTGTEEDAPADSGSDTGTAADSATPADTGSGPEDTGTDTGVVIVDSGTAVDSTSSSDTGTVSATDSGTVADTGTHMDAPVDAPAEAASEAGGDGSVASEAGDASDGGVACTSTMAFLAGGATAVYAGTWSNGAWGALQNLTGTTGSVASVPALVSNGTEYVGVLQEKTTNFLDYTLSGAVWSPLAGVPPTSAAPTTAAAPALAAIGGAVHLVYLGTGASEDFYHGAYSGGTWSIPASDPVEPSGGVQSFGPSAPTAAAGTSGFTIVQAGSDFNLYTQSWNANWGAATQVPMATLVANTISPRIITLSGGTASQMIVYASNVTNGGNLNVLYYTVLTGSTWSAPTVVNGTTVYSPNPVSIAPIAGGGAVLVYEGGNDEPYFVIYNPASTPTWSAPEPLVTGTNPTVTAPPQVAQGVCGEDAVAIYPTATTALQVTTLKSGTWSTPAPLAGTSGATFATIATQQ